MPSLVLPRNSPTLENSPAFGERLRRPILLSFSLPIFSGYGIELPWFSRKGLAVFDFATQKGALSFKMTRYACTYTIENEDTKYIY
jgi:hypothetical protein